jgi:hypothetical protein
MSATVDARPNCFVAGLKISAWRSRSGAANPSCETNGTHNDDPVDAGDGDGVGDDEQVDDGREAALEARRSVRGVRRVSVCSMSLAELGVTMPRAYLARRPPRRKRNRAEKAEPVMMMVRRLNRSTAVRDEHPRGGCGHPDVPPKTIRTMVQATLTTVRIPLARSDAFWPV